MTAPVRRVQLKPAFWGVERDLKDVMESIENIWEGDVSKTHNFKETEKAFLLSIDLPGVNKSTLELHQEGDHIQIKGIKKNAFYEEESSEDATILRTVALPKMVDKEKIEAHLEDGVLYLAMPKVEKAIPRKIAIAEGNNTKWNKLLSKD
ncbi:MAG: HSP20 family protein [Bacteriovoracaceae bacterium]|jgi:HSP20 family protein